MATLNPYTKCHNPTPTKYKKKNKLEKKFKEKYKIPVPRNYKLSLKRYIHSILIKCTSRQFYKQYFLIPQENNGGSHKR